MVLMRLFQLAALQVEIQPQLVLLQKTLLNIEGLGRQLDPTWICEHGQPLEKWMLDQMGPQRLWSELEAQAPRYTAKILPDLPRLLSDYLQHKDAGQAQLTQALLQEQRRTNRLLQSVLYAGLGFVLGLIVAQAIVRFQLF